MNLKTAARRLGVHYQTAYRWVRSGQLVAVKIGPGYEISDAALERFRAQRSALERVPEAPSVPDATVEPADDALAQLDAMVAQTTVDASAVVQRAADLVATVIGDAVTVSLPKPDGALHWAAFAHRDPERAVGLGAQLRFSAPELTHARQAVETGDAVFVPQLPQREARAMIRPEFYERLDTAGFFSAVGAPVDSNGLGRGAVLATRDAPGCPYRADDREFVAAVAARVGTAIVRAELGRHAWELRSTLAAALSEWIVHDRFGRPRDWLIDEVDDAEPAAVIDLDMRVDGATTAFAELFGTTASECKERILTELVRSPARVADVFERLRAGEYDFATTMVRPCAPGAGVVVLDSVAVRMRDATPSCVLYVAHRVPATQAPETTSG